MRAWVVRGGRKGRFEPAALGAGVVILGWEEIPDLAQMTNPEAIRSLVEQTYPEKSSYVIGNWTGQLWRFRGEMSVGDLVVLPRTGNRLAIGRITGDYSWQPVADLAPAHIRKVDWLRPDAPRTEAMPDLRDSLGSLLTVYELRRNNAAKRIEALAQGLPDPGSPQADEVSAGFGSTQELLDAAAARENGDPIVLTVRGLLSHWGAHRRGSFVVQQIQRDLAEMGLTTKPPFNDGDVNSNIAIVPLDVDPDEVDPEDIADEAELPPISYLVGNLASARAEVVDAKPYEPLEDAKARMKEHNYSQLPVVAADNTLKGAVTWQSIAHANQETGRELRVIDAITFAPFARSSDALLSKVSDISHHGYVFVVDTTGHVDGVITSADLASQFSNRVEPFILVEEVEQRLRRLVDAAISEKKITLARIREVLGDKKDAIQSAKDLTLGQYRPLFAHSEIWDGLALGFNHEFFLKWVYEVKEFRNSLMHFSPDPLTPADLVTVQGFLNLLRALHPTTA